MQVIYLYLGAIDRITVYWHKMVDENKTIYEGHGRPNSSAKWHQMFHNSVTTNNQWKENDMIASGKFIKIWLNSCEWHSKWAISILVDHTYSKPYQHKLDWQPYYDMISLAKDSIQSHFSNRPIYQIEWGCHLENSAWTFPYMTCVIITQGVCTLLRIIRQFLMDVGPRPLLAML